MKHPSKYQGKVTNVITRGLHLLPPEWAHQLALWSLRIPLPPCPIPDLPEWPRTYMGLSFRHPICLAAGFDKDATAIPGLLRLGFSAVEVGSVTRNPQSGNPKPRIFKLPHARALINRCGFNSCGVECFVKNVKRHTIPGVTGVNLGLNKTSSDPCADIRYMAAQVTPHADYITMNVSSPNTPKLRDKQTPEQLETLVAALHEGMNNAGAQRPLVVKIAPDLDPVFQKELLAYIASASIDGVIVANTSVSREGLEPTHVTRETGGLSGPPLAKRARDLLIATRAAVGPDMCVIASGGIETGADVVDRLICGADLVQIYTALIFRGPRLPAMMIREMQTASPAP